MSIVIDSFRGEYYFLSNYYSCKVTYDGLVYMSSEAAYQAQKSLDMPEKLQFIQYAPSEAKLRGKEINLRADWDDVKRIEMLNVLFCKFSQNILLREKLLNTKDAVLIEGNTWHDQYWGSCVCSEHIDLEGENHLGKLLVKVRNELRNS